MRMIDFSDIFQSRLRLMIISALLSGNKTFKELQSLTGATDGNISVQISKLETAEFLTVKKSFVGRKPQTTLAITEKGRISESPKRTFATRRSDWRTDCNATC